MIKCDAYSTELGGKAEELMAELVLIIRSIRKVKGDDGEQMIPDMLTAKALALGFAEEGEESDIVPKYDPETRTVSFGLRKEEENT